jgi:hypothetical protein
VHFNITEHPTAQWTAQQIVEALPWDTAPRYLLRDRDAIYGEHVQQRITNMGIEEVKIAPRSPWQNPYCERVIGSIRREVSTMSSCSTSSICSACCAPTWAIITPGVRIDRWRWTRRNRESFSHRRWVQCGSSRKSADFITIMNG